MERVQRGRTVGRRRGCEGRSVRSVPRARPAIVARALAVLVALASWSCRERAPDPIEVERWVIAAPHPTQRELGERDRCEIGTETRPAMGCPRLMSASPIGELARTEGTVSRKYRTPAHLYRNRSALFARSYRKSEHEEWKPLPPVFVSKVTPEIEIDFPIPESAREGPLEVSLNGYALPPISQTLETDVVRIPPGAVLEGGFGVDPLSADAAGPAVQFKIVARTGSGDRTLLEELLDPASERARHWVDYRIDLADLAGQDARFLLGTRVVLQAGERSDRGFGIPLWSGGRILVPRPGSTRPNVVLISLDTLRADHVGAYGSEVATPNLDRLAAEGALFENVVAPYPSTTASHMSMLTGLYPDVHGILAPNRMLSDEIPTLAEIFAANGYQTAAVTEDGMVAARSGFSRGFGSYREFKEWDPALTDGYVREGVDSALAWLDRHRGERFFLFLHTYQVHDPFAPPAEFRPAETASDASPLARSRAAYAGEVRYTDREVGRLLAGLEERGLAEDTVVVLTSDHGEAFGEHGAVGHGWFLIEPVTSVPLIVRAPGSIPAGRRVATPVSLVDVTPTVLALARIPAPAGTQGWSLLPLLEDPDAASYRERVVYTQHDRGERASYGARRGDRKWLFRKGEEPRAFDLRSDPGEERPLLEPALIAEGRRSLDEFHEANRKTVSRLSEPEPAPVAVDDATQEKLRRLGYVE
jgi:arylsulfatase A-like enzyme